MWLIRGFENKWNEMNYCCSAFCELTDQNDDISKRILAKIKEECDDSEIASFVSTHKFDGHTSDLRRKEYLD